MKIGILALQGAFAEHGMMLDKLSIPHFEIRCVKDLEQGMDGLIIPGGESTVQGKLLRELDMFDTLKDHLDHDMPVMGTCGGLILLAKHLENDPRTYFATLPVSVRRNAYGRQLGSFYTEDAFEGIGTVPMTFIRAPFIERVGKEVEVLSTVAGRVVAARQQQQLVCAFHPELTPSDTRIHEYFLTLAQG